MSYVYPKAADLDGQPVVGTRQCVALVQEYAGAPITTTWRQGESVIGNRMLKTGTAIATFVNGRYLNRAHGNHAALTFAKRQMESILPTNGKPTKR